MANKAKQFRHQHVLPRENACILQDNKMAIIGTVPPVPICGSQNVYLRFCFFFKLRFFLSPNCALVTLKLQFGHFQFVVWRSSNCGFGFSQFKLVGVRYCTFYFYFSMLSLFHDIEGCFIVCGLCNVFEFFIHFSCCCGCCSKFI